MDVPANMDGLVPPELFNPNRILTVVSSDGGNNFSPMTIADVNSQNENDTNGQQVLTGRPARATARRPIATSTRRSRSARGGLPTESGLSGDPGIPGGQVAVTWDNFGSNQP